MAAPSAPQETYLALLRGINVGGKNVIRMADLRGCFEAHGFSDAVTYIQSGNVIFREPATALGSLATRIEDMLAAAFGYEARVVLRTREQVQAVVTEAPPAFGSEPKLYRYDTIFMRAPLTLAAAMEVIPARPGVDAVWPGPDVLYYSRLISKASRSHLSRLVSMRIYQDMTVRNWNTTSRLLRLMNERRG